jgi:DNA-binding beta-propeller fold protein YncE
MMAATVYGSGDYRYTVVPDWGRGPAGVPSFGLVSMVACDAEDRVYVFQRAPEPVMLVFEPDGTLASRWGDGHFKHPHGVWVAPDQTLYLTDRDTHLVTQWTRDGQLLRSWGTPNQPGAPGEPFNEPTRAVVAPNGDLFVSDGYGQYRVHRFAPDGTLLRSWGSQGTGPGQFGWPVHSVHIDPRGRVLVIDRQNGRVQHFSEEGDYLGEWANLLAPNDLYIDPSNNIIIAEGGPRISVLDLDGSIISQWGERGEEQGQFAAAPHGCWADSRGDLYVSEVVAHNRIQKFARVR